MRTLCKKHMCAFQLTRWTRKNRTYNIEWISVVFLLHWPLHTHTHTHTNELNEIPIWRFSLHSTIFKDILFVFITYLIFICHCFLADGINIWLIMNMPQDFRGIFNNLSICNETKITIISYSTKKDNTFSKFTLD